MTNDWTWHVDALKSRLSELNETIETIKNSVEKRPGLETATRAMAPLLTGNQSELSHFPAVLGNILKDPLLGALLVGPQGEFVLFNLPAQDMLGREYLSGSGRVGYRILDVSQTLALEARDLPWNKALGGESLNDVRLYLSGDEGFESRWLSVSATPFRGHQNEVYGAVVFMIDSTEEITLESSIGAICNTISSQIAQVGSTHNQLKDLSDKLSNTGVQRLLTKGAEPGYQEGLGGKPSQEKKSQANRKTSPPLDSIPEPPEQQAAILDALDNDSPPLPDSTFSTVETDGFAFSDSKPEPEPKLEEIRAESESPVDFKQGHIEQELEDQYEKVSQTGDEDEDSAESPESLFGKLKSATRDKSEESSRSDKKADRSESAEELESGLPWPNLVDADDYTQPLWEEYTQTDDTAAANSYAEQIEPEILQIEEESTNGSLLADKSGEHQELQANDNPESKIQSEQFIDNKADELDRESLLQIHQAEELIEKEVVSEFEEAVQEEQAIEVEAELEADVEIEAEAWAEGETEPEPLLEPEPSHPPVAEEPAKPSLRDTLFKKKSRASRSYNKLKSLGSASELEESMLDDSSGIESVESQVVSYRPIEEEQGELTQKRVLVVDDIPVNQKLLLLHLNRLGYEADIANNGQEALDALAVSEYELILMDCDMPVMNGFEAAARIRNNEAYAHSRIPIIALTSYDREGDREKCIAAGMDDYITKGASRKELKETIERSIVSAREKSQGLPSEDDREDDMPPLDIDSMLKLYGKEEVEEISKLFLSNMGTYIECMQLAIDEKDSESVVHFSNAVKGPCAALGIKLMTRLTTDIITFAEEGDWTQVRVKYMRLKAVFVQTREKLKKICPDDSLMTT